MRGRMLLAVLLTATALVATAAEPGPAAGGTSGLGPAPSWPYWGADRNPLLQTAPRAGSAPLPGAPTVAPGTPTTAQTESAGAAAAAQRAGATGAAQPATASANGLATAAVPGAPQPSATMSGNTAFTAGAAPSPFGGLASSLPGAPATALGGSLGQQPSAVPAAAPALQSPSSSAWNAGGLSTASGSSAIAETPTDWYARSARLPRLGANLTAGTVGARPLAADYRLRGGDRLRIVAWGGATLNEAVIVDPSGGLGVPGLGMVPVAGLTVAEAQQRVVELVRSQFRNGGAIIGVEQPGAQAVTVAGEVSRPGYLALPPGGNVLDALALAGGVTDAGSLRVIRITAPGTPPETVDLYRLAVDGDASGLHGLPDGAFVFVPVSGPQVQVFGAVRRPACVELLPDQPLTEALRCAGGLTADGDRDNLRLVRESAEGQRLQQQALAALAGIPAADGDRLLVAARSALTQSRRAVALDGAVRSPGIYPLADGLTVARLIAAAGGALPEADLAGTTIRRRLERPQMMDQGGGVTRPVLDQVIAEAAADTVLQPLDIVMVPAFAPLEEATLTVSVAGAVRRPGVLPLVPDLTAQQAIALAGGVAADAQLDQADLVRVVLLADGSRSVQRQSIDLRAVLQGQPGPVLQARDQLVVRRRNDQRLQVVVEGEVFNSGTFTVPNGTTVGQVLAMCGGLTKDGFVRGIRLYRDGEKRQAQEYIADLQRRLENAVAINKRQLYTARDQSDTQALEQTIQLQENELARVQKAVATGRMLGIDFAGILAGRGESDIALHDGDRIEVPAKPGTYRVFGEVMNPGSLRFERGIGVRTAIARSGGLGQQADGDRIFVVRADGSVVAQADSRGTMWDEQRRRWVETKLNSLELVEGDTVIVPPDLTYRDSKLKIAKDLSQILFQVAVTAGTVAVLAM